MATTVGFFNPKNGFQAQIVDRMEAESARQMAQQLAMAQLANQLMLEKGRSADAAARNASNERIADIQAKGVVEASKARAAVESDSMKRTRLQNARLDSEARKWVQVANAAIADALKKYKETGIELDGTSIPQAWYSRFVGKRKPSAEEIADYTERLRSRYSTAATALIRSGKVTVDDAGNFVFTGSAPEADWFDATPEADGGGAVAGQKPGQAPNPTVAQAGGKADSSVEVEIVPLDPSMPGYFLIINGKKVKVSHDVWNDHAEAVGYPGDRKPSKGAGKPASSIVQPTEQDSGVPLLLNLLPKDVTADAARGVAGVIKQTLLGGGDRPAQETRPSGEVVDASKIIETVKGATDMIDASKMVQATKVLAAILGSINQPPAASNAQLSGPMAGALDAIRRIHAASNSVSR